MRLEQHVNRLISSAAALDLQMPASFEAGLESTANDIRAAIGQLLSASRLTDARVRLTMTPGAVPRPGQTIEHPAPPTVLITASPVQPYPEEHYRHGMRVCICPYQQSVHDPLAGHKTLGYLPRLLGMKHAAERQCNEALWFTIDNHLAEGSFCNVFLWHEGTLLTPPTQTPILAGIVRGCVLELARRENLPVDERPIDIETLLAAQEVFLTASIMEVMPVTAIEKHVVGSGRVGDASKRFAELYRSLVACECATRGPADGA
jgi:branched-subunit amino acid aminotransferase/4-amino-4-deoxychorismate lyase